MGSVTALPVAPMGVSNDAHMVALPEATCATEGGRLKCWGGDFSGQMGAVENVLRSAPGSALDAPEITSVLPVGATLASLSMAGTTTFGSPHACALASGAAYCWGYSTGRATGRTSHIPSQVPTMIAIPGSSEVVFVQAAYGATAMVVGDGRVFAIGPNSGGRIVPGESGSYGTPQEIMLGDAATEAGFGTAHGCALVDDEVWCWGDNSRAQLGRVGGDGTPAVVAGLGPALQLAVGGNFNCALVDEDPADEVWCWGGGNHSQLGNSVTDSTSPVQVIFPALGMDQPVSVSAGNAQACVTTAAGSVYCWGQNNVGQASGMGDAHGPVRVIDTGVDEVRAYFEHSCARSGAEVRCWGSNRYFELGVSTPETISRTPLVVGGIADVTALASGSSGVSTCVHTSAGHRCWGACLYGSCGDRDPRASTPVTITEFDR